MPVQRNIAPGWKREPVHVLGRGTRIGEKFGLFGPKPGMACGRLPGARKSFIVVGCGGGYLLFLTDLFGKFREIFPKKTGNLGESEPIGAPDSHLNSQFYPCLYPIGAGRLFHIVAGRGRTETLEYYRKLDKSGNMRFFWHMPFLNLKQKGGKPAAIDWERKGRYDLLAGEADGYLRRYRLKDSGTSRGARRPPSDISGWAARSARGSGPNFSAEGEIVFAGGAPIFFPDWLYPCVIDWDNKGRSDLLIGTASGDVWLFRDIGDKRAVAYDRGRVLQTMGGRLWVGSFAVPAAVPSANGSWSHLLAMNGAGELFAYEKIKQDAYVLGDWRKALAGQEHKVSGAYKKGFWLLGKVQQDGVSRNILTTCPACLGKRPAKPDFATLVENVVPALELNPALKGEHEVHVGIFHPPRWPEFNFALPPHVQVRTSADKTAELAFPGEKTKLARQEIYMGRINLTGKSVILSQTRGNYKYQGGYPCCVEYIRLVPVKSTLLPAHRKDHKRGMVVAGIFDTFDWTMYVSTDDEKSVRDVIDKHIKCGFNRIYYKTGGGCWEYPTKVKGGESVIDYPGSRVREKWPDEDYIGHFTRLNRVKLAADHSRRKGLEFFAWIRITNQSEHFGSGFPLYRFYVDHPAMRDRTRFGGPMPRISLTWPGAVQYMLAMCREMISFGIDGIMIDFLRTMPTVTFPDPVVNSFQRRYGQDPRRISPVDPKVLDTQCRFVTGFLRNLRSLLRKSGAKLELHARIDNIERSRGLDPVAWIREGLVDAIIIENSLPDPTEPPLQEALVACRGSRCKVIAGFYRTYWGKNIGYPIHPEIIRNKTKQYFAAGAAGVSFYETAEVLRYADMRRAIRRINEPDIPFSMI